MLSLRLRPPSAPALFADAASAETLPYEFGNFEIVIIASRRRPIRSCSLLCVMQNFLGAAILPIR